MRNVPARPRATHEFSQGTRRNTDINGKDRFRLQVLQQRSTWSLVASRKVPYRRAVMARRNGVVLNVCRKFIYQPRIAAVELGWPQGLTCEEQTEHP
jgi:hypothetical protein